MATASITVTGQFRKCKVHNKQSDICKLDFSACGTLASQLADNISRAIACGDLKPGDKLPSIATMARLCRTSVRIPREAVRLLENEGILKGRPRSGLIVLDKKRFVWRGSVLFVSYGRQSYFYRGVLFKNIAQRLAEKGWRVDFVNVVCGDGNKEVHLLPLRRALQNGHRLVCGAHLDAPTVEEIRKAAVPYFAIGGLTGDECANAVGFASFSEARAIVEMAEASVKAGVRRVLHVMIDAADQLFRLPFEQRGVVTEKIIVHPDSGIDRFSNNADFVYRRVKERLANRRLPKVDLLYFADDSFTAAGLWAVHDAGLRIPEEIRCVTFSNNGNRPFFRLPLTRIEHDLVAHTGSIAHRMLAFLDGKASAGRVTCSARFMRGKTL